MPISNTDIQFRQSGGASNNDPNACLGGAISANSAPASLFDTVASLEASTGRTEYRCIYILNANGSLTLSGARVWFSAVSNTGRATHAVGVGTSPVNGTEDAIGAETILPNGVSFSSPTTEATAVAIGDIPAGQHKAIWIRRSVPPGAASGTDGFTINVAGDSPP